MLIGYIWKIFLEDRLPPKSSNPHFFVIFLQGKPLSLPAYARAWTWRWTTGTNMMDFHQNSLFLQFHSHIQHYAANHKWIDSSWLQNQSIGRIYFPKKNLDVYNSEFRLSDTSVHGRFWRIRFGKLQMENVSIQSHLSCTRPSSRILMESVVIRNYFYISLNISIQILWCDCCGQQNYFLEFPQCKRKVTKITKISLKNATKSVRLYLSFGWMYFRYQI